jgi:S-layer homology domain
MRKAFTRIMAVLALSSLLFVQMASATVETTTPEFTDDANSAVSLEASINEAGTVDLTWDAYTGENFKYYKAVGSQDIVEPKYPEDSYIGYIPDINVTSYTTTVEESPEGLNYYSLCVVLEGSIRGCTSISIEVPAHNGEVVETPEEDPVADLYTDDETIAVTLEGTLNDLGKVELSWNAYEGGDLQWYKVVHSQTNTEAVYPADGHIEAYSDPSIVEYLHTDVPEGTNYYRVCVITDTDIRGCSNTVTIENGEASVVEAAVFADTEGHWAETYIDDLAAEGVVEGNSDGMFEPNKNVLRAEATKMVVIGLGYEETACDATIFPDLNSGDWFCGVVTIAYKKGIISGDDGKLYPARNMTRAEAVKILLEAKGITPPEVTENPFSDVNKDAWYAPYVNKASILGYIEGSNGMFEPNREITRAELAKIVSLAS